MWRRGILSAVAAGAPLKFVGNAMITFTLKESLTVPLEAEMLSPDHVATLDNAAIRAMPVYLGKRRLTVGDFFGVDGEASDHLQIRGDCAKVKWIGKAMTRGRIDVIGNAGMHLGSGMKRGAIEVTGNASDWLGAEMTGGSIRIRGNAGGQVGAAYRGSLGGMRDGLIVIDGGAGLEVGMRMKRGTIVIKGKVRDFAGLQMKGGTLVLLGGAEIRAGAQMIRGTILSATPIKLLPTFSYACRYQPSVLGVYTKFLRRIGVATPFETTGTWLRYSGDTAVPGKGEIFIWDA